METLSFLEGLGVTFEEVAMKTPADRSQNPWLRLAKPSDMTTVGQTGRFTGNHMDPRNKTRRASCQIIWSHVKNKQQKTP